MIAVIERQHKAVWGFGHTAEEAMAHAMKSISEKPWFTVNGLEYAHLAPEAELDCDGEVLWQWVIQPQAVKQGQQVELF